MALPPKTYDYIVNSKSVIWSMEHYAVITHKESGTWNDFNNWVEGHEKPRCMLDLLSSVIKVSLETVDIVNNLQKIGVLKVLQYG
jgi:predicted helicase